MTLRPGSIAALIAAAWSLGVDVVYLLIIHGEGEGELTRSRVIFVAASIGAAAALAFAGALTSKPLLRFALLAFAALLLLAYTLLGAMSIGVLLLVPTVLALRSAAHAAKELRLTAALGVALGGVGSVLALVSVGLSGTS